MSAKDALGTIVVRIFIGVVILFLVAAWQSGMLDDFTSWIKLPSVSVDTK